VGLSGQEHVPRPQDVRCDDLRWRAGTVVGNSAGMDHGVTSPHCVENGSFVAKILSIDKVEWVNGPPLYLEVGAHCSTHTAG
jgi:hypothetical protein